MTVIAKVAIVVIAIVAVLGQLRRPSRRHGCYSRHRKRTEDLSLGQVQRLIVVKRPLLSLILRVVPTCGITTHCHGRRGRCSRHGHRSCHGDRSRRSRWGRCAPWFMHSRENQKSFFVIKLSFRNLKFLLIRGRALSGILPFVIQA